MLILELIDAAAFGYMVFLLARLVSLFKSNKYNTINDIYPAANKLLGLIASMSIISSVMSVAIVIEKYYIP